MGAPAPVTISDDIESCNTIPVENEHLLKQPKPTYGPDDLLSTDEDNDDSNVETSLLSTITEGVQEVFGNVVEGVQGVAENVVEGVQGVAENVVEGVQEVAGGVQEVMENVQEAIMEEMHEVKDTFVEELYQADEGDTFFLEMGLTRGMSLIPDDLPQVVTEVTGVEVDKVTHYDPKKGSIPISAYFLLASAVISISSVGGCLDLQKRVSPAMKFYWRMTGTGLALLPFVCQSIYKSGLPRLSLTNWCTFVFATICYVIFCLSFISALDYTSVGNAAIFSNSQALLLIAGKALVGAPIMLLEGVGAAVAFSGAICVGTDSGSAAGPLDEPKGLAIIGELLAVLAAFGGIGYFTFAKTVRPQMSVIMFMFLMMFLGQFFVLAFMALSGQKLSASTNVDYGLWGWLNWRNDRLPLELYIVLVCNLLGTMGYIRAMKYFDNVVIAVATLMEPVVGTLIAVQMGVGTMPGMKGIAGNVLVAAGTFLVVYPTVEKK